MRIDGRENDEENSKNKSRGNISQTSAKAERTAPQLSRQSGRTGEPDGKNPPSRAMRTLAKFSRSFMKSDWE